MDEKGMVKVTILSWSIQIVPVVARALVTAEGQQTAALSIAAYAVVMLASIADEELPRVKRHIAIVPIEQIFSPWATNAQSAGGWVHVSNFQ